MKIRTKVRDYTPPSGHARDTFFAGKLKKETILLPDSSWRVDKAKWLVSRQLLTPLSVRLLAWNLEQEKYLAEEKQSHHDATKETSFWSKETSALGKRLFARNFQID